MKFLKYAFLFFLYPVFIHTAETQIQLQTPSQEQELIRQQFKVTQWIQNPNAKYFTKAFKLISEDVASAQWNIFGFDIYKKLTWLGPKQPGFLSNNALLRQIDNSNDNAQKKNVVDLLCKRFYFLKLADVLRTDKEQKLFSVGVNKTFFSDKLLATLGWLVAAGSAFCIAVLSFTKTLRPADDEWLLVPIMYGFGIMIPTLRSCLQLTTYMALLTFMSLGHAHAAANSGGPSENTRVRQVQELEKIKAIIDTEKQKLETLLKKL